MKHKMLLNAVCVWVSASCAAPPDPYGRYKEFTDTQENSDAQAQATGSSTASGADAQDGSGDAAPPSSTPTPTPTATPSAASCDNGSSVMTGTLRVVIPKNDPSNGGMRCPFGQGDNNSASDGKFSARLERKVDVTIPASAQLCSVKPTVAQQSLKFDDHLFVVLNQNVLLASRGMPSNVFQRAPTGFYQFDWLKIRGTEHNNYEPSTGCAVGLTCTFPQADTRGNFALTISDDAAKRLATAVSGKPITVSAVVTGDNNSSDCAQLDDIIVNVNYTYVQK